MMNGKEKLTTFKMLAAASALLLLTACSPEVGTQAWCEQLVEKQKGDWSANEATDYAKHCLFN